MRVVLLIILTASTVLRPDSPDRRWLKVIMAQFQVQVVIPTTGRSSLGRALRSCADQQLTVEAIVVDDSPKADTTVPAVDCAVRVLRTKGLGLAGARNAGMLLTDAPFTAFLDDDDWFCPHHLVRLTHCIEQSDAAIAYSAVNVITVRESGAVNEIQFGWPFRRDHIAVTNQIPPSAVLFKTDVGLRFDVDLRVQEDWAAWLQLIQQGHEFTYSAFATCNYAKDLVANDSMTVRAAAELDSITTFAKTYIEVANKFPTNQSDVLAGRHRMQMRYTTWRKAIQSGDCLPINYYELALADEFGPPEATACCTSCLNDTTFTGEST